MSAEAKASRIRRPVGRPRVDRSKAASRIAILDAAEQLFAKQGYHGTATSAIAKKAKVTTGLVFYYFPSKELLLKALIEERAVLPKIAERLPKPGEREFSVTMQDAGHRLYDIIRDSQSMVRIVTSEVPHHRYIQRQWERMLEATLDDLTAYVAAASRGALDPEQAAPLARTLFSTIAFHAIFDPDYDRTKLVNGLVGLLTRS